MSNDLLVYIKTSAQHGGLKVEVTPNLRCPQQGKHFVPPKVKKLCNTAIAGLTPETAYKQLSAPRWKLMEVVSFRSTECKEAAFLMRHEHTSQICHRSRKDPRA